MNRPAPIRLKKCSKCGGEWDEEAFFRKNPDKRSGQVYLPETRSVCIGCELTERNDPTPEERARRKAQNTIRDHAEKRDMLPSEFAKRYGWDVERMVYDIIHGHKNTCTYCWEKYERMGHGLSDMTLDVIDRGREPYYRTNTKWCCATCNREKASLTPDLWDRRLIVWPIYMRWRNGVLENPVHGLPLFADRALLMIVGLIAGVLGCFMWFT